MKNNLFYVIELYVSFSLIGSSDDYVTSWSTNKNEGLGN